MKNLHPIPTNNWILSTSFLRVPRSNFPNSFLQWRLFKLPSTNLLTLQLSGFVRHYAEVTAKTKRLVIGLNVLVACMIIPHVSLASESTASVINLPSISANLLRYNKFDNASTRHSVVMMSSEGVRFIDVRGSDEKAHNEFIQNFVIDKAWMLSVRRGVYTTLSLTSDAHDAELVRPANDTVPEGVLTNEPCLNMSGTKMGESLWRGYPVELWHCRFNDLDVSTQLFSASWSLVVREETANGDVAELRDIRERDYPDDWFEPAKRYREVDIVEFVRGVAKLSEYDNTKSLPISDIEPKK